MSLSFEIILIINILQAIIIHSYLNMDCIIYWVNDNIINNKYIKFVYIISLINKIKV